MVTQTKSSFGLKRFLAEKNCCLSRYRFKILMNKILCSISAQYVANKHIGIDVKPRPNDRNMSTQYIATYVACVAMDVVVDNLKLSTLSQQPPKCCNRMAKRTQHVAPNNVAIVWPGLYNYRRRLTTKIKASASIPCDILTELRCELAAEKQTPIRDFS